MVSDASEQHDSSPGAYPAWADQTPPVADLGSAEHFRVLAVVADLRLAARIACPLDQLGHSVKVASTARAAEERLGRSAFDAVVVDLDMEGVPVEAALRPAVPGPGPATILLRSHAEPAERVRWLKAGAADFVPSPILAAEVVARVEVALRARRLKGVGQWRGIVESLRINEATGEVEVDGRRHRLSPMEHKLLRHLASTPGRVFTRHELLRDVWGYTTGSDATLTVHIRKLREKIERGGTRPVYIRTRQGIGYYLATQPRA